jgi:hypothetical protein
MFNLIFVALIIIEENGNQRNPKYLIKKQKHPIKSINF